MRADVVYVALLVGLGISAVATVVVIVSLVCLCAGRRRSTNAALPAASVAWLALASWVIVAVVPVRMDAMLNGIFPQALPFVSEQATRLHSSLSVADLHADSLLWPRRDLLVRNDFSHVDVPRLVEGRIAVQAFTIVTSTPANHNYFSNAEPTGFFSDQIVLKALLEGWGGLEVIDSKRVRTLFQIAQLHRFEARSNGTLMIIKTKADLDNVLKLHRAGEKVVGGFLGIEGLHALDNNVSNVELFYRAGVRMAGMTHLFDNALAGSAHGLNKGGLTELGRGVYSEMKRLGYLIDIAHSSHASIADIIAEADNQTVIMTSHTGLQSVCGSYERNLSDDELRAIAKTGGVIGIAFFPPAMCGDDIVASILDSIVYAKNLVGVEHVGLGSDWDGNVRTPFDAAGIVHVTNGLLERGLSEAEVRLIMVENVFRMLRRVLP